MAELEQLPKELLLLICERLAREDLLSLRLTSRTLSRCASVPLFAVVGVRPPKHSAENFGHILEHSHLSEKIRHVSFDTGTVELAQVVSQRKAYTPHLTNHVKTSF